MIEDDRKVVLFYRESKCYAEMPEGCSLHTMQPEKSAKNRLLKIFWNFLKKVLDKSQKLCYN